MRSRRRINLMRPESAERSRNLTGKAHAGHYCIIVPVFERPLDMPAITKDSGVERVF